MSWPGAVLRSGLHPNQLQLGPRSGGCRAVPAPHAPVYSVVFTLGLSPMQLSALSCQRGRSCRTQPANSNTASWVLQDRIVPAGVPIRGCEMAAVPSSPSTRLSCAGAAPPVAIGATFFTFSTFTECHAGERYGASILASRGVHTPTKPERLRRAGSHPPKVCAANLSFIQYSILVFLHIIWLQLCT